jgi:hypothetical protein
MAGKSKGKAKGQESWEDKMARVAKERKEAEDYAVYMAGVCDRHTDASTWWAPQGSQAKGSGKGKGSGKTSSPSAAAQKEIKRLKQELSDAKNKRGRSTTPKGTPKGQRTRSRSKSRDRSASATSATSSNGSGKVVNKLTKEQRAERNAAKKKKRQEARRAKQQPAAPEDNDGAPDDPPAKQTRLCTRCAYKGTYASSVKCFGCKKPFPPEAPHGVSAAPAAPAVAPKTPSPAAAASISALQTIQEEAKARAAALAPAAKPKVSFNAPAPTPALASPAAGSAASSHNAAAAPMSIDLTTADTGLDNARKLTTLRAQKAKYDAQCAEFHAAPTVQAAIAALSKGLDQQIADLLEKQQGELEPHQLGLVLSQRQRELSEAMQRTAEWETAAAAKLDEHDQRATSIAKDFALAVQAALDAQQQSATALAAERSDLVVALEAQITKAKEGQEAAKQLMDVLQSQINALSPEVEEEADAVASPLLRPTATPVVPAIIPMAHIPEQKPVEEGDMAIFALASRVLDHHAIQDRDFPLSFENVGLPRQQVAKMVGAPIWTHHFPLEQPERSARIPRRMLGALKVAMTRLALSTQACADIEDTAVSSAIAAAAQAHEDRLADSAQGHSLEPY